MTGFQPIDPFASFQQGYGVGNAINQNRIAKAQAEAEAARQAEIDSLLDIAMGPGGTPQDYLRLNRLMTPEEQAGFQKAWEGMELQEQQNTIKETAEYASLFSTGNYGLLEERLNRDLQAYTNAGDKQGVKATSDLLKMLKEDPKMAEAFFMGSAAGIPGMEDVLTNLSKQQTMDLNILELARKYPFSSDADKNRTLTAVREMGLPSGAAEKVVELSSILSGADGMDSKDYAQLLGQYEDRYNKLVDDYVVIDDNAAAILVLDEAQIMDGMADVALITLWNKVLDPNSVVRQEEVKNTLAAQGMFEAAKNLPDKIIEGSALSDEARNALVAATDIINKSAQQRMAGIQEDQAILITDALGADAVDTIITKRINLLDQEEPTTPPAQSPPVNRDPAAAAFSQWILSNRASTVANGKERELLRTGSLEEIKAVFKNAWDAYQESLNTPIPDNAFDDAEVWD